MTGPEPQHPSGWRPRILVVFLTGGVVAVSATLLAQAEPAPGFRPPDLLTWVLTLGGAAAVIWARRQPLVALVMTGTAYVVLSWRDDATELAPFLVTGLLFMVGNQRTRRPAVAGLVWSTPPSICWPVPRPDHRTSVCRDSCSRSSSSPAHG